MFLGSIISIVVLLGYPTCGLKAPQKDNPLFWRKKYGTTTTVQQFQQLAMIEYGAKVPKGQDTNVMLSNRGFQMVGQGFRIDLDNYGDLVC